MRTTVVRLLTVFVSYVSIASCDQAQQVAPRAALDKQASAASDTRKITYELREKCARDAMEWFKHFHEGESVVDQVALTTQNEYRNHYNDKLNRCYALVLNTRMLVKDLCALNTMSLVDVQENNQIGDYFKNCKAPTPVRCSVAGQACASQEQFEDLATPYLTN